MENNYNVSPNEVFGFAMRMHVKKEILKQFEPYDKSYMKTALTIQKDVIEEILYELKKENK